VSAAVEVLRQARQFGAHVAANGDRLDVEAPAPLPTLLVEELRRCKPEILALLENIEERSAIIEHDGGYDRDDADRMAWERMIGSGRLQ
jgi:hypothetical protein